MINLHKIRQTKCNYIFPLVEIRLKLYFQLGAGALGWPRGMEWGGRREEGSGWGTCVYLWHIHVDIWQNQYNIVKLKNKKNKRNTSVNDGKPVSDGKHFRKWGVHMNNQELCLVRKALSVYRRIYRSRWEWKQGDHLGSLFSIKETIRAPTRATIKGKMKFPKLCD